MKTPQRYLLYFLPLLLVGCASIGLVTPETFREKLATGYSNADAIDASALKALQAKKIRPDDAENIDKQTDNLKAALDVARGLRLTDSVAANAKLTATLTALNALSAYLGMEK